jgi:L-seryl-tRNA(Ser) seleniumtransferase
MTSMDTQSLLRGLPKVDELLKRDDVEAAVASYGRDLVVDSLRDALEAAREAILAGSEEPVFATGVVEDAFARIDTAMARSLARVVNATGIVIHTNLGRSILSGEAIEAVAEVAGSYSTLEYDVESGERGSRHVHVERLLTELSGAEAAMAVNNNASAVMIALSALAGGREAVVSRGQLIEIGGSFRIPDIMSASGARMVEVGTTNKTRAADYEAAIGPETGVLLRVHSSNYRMVGFTEEVTLAELVALGERHEVPVYEDQGSGVLVDLRSVGLPWEPTMREAIEAGADLVSASGDKLLGGPQAGLLVGTAEVIERLKAHPLARVLRLDKMTLAALEVTLRAYLDPERVFERIPTLRMLAASEEEMAKRAASLAARIVEAADETCETDVVDDVSRAGGGSLPMADIPTRVVAVSPLEGSVVELEERLRANTPPIVARIKDDRLRIDPRTLSAADEDEIVAAFARILG